MFGDDLECKNKMILNIVKQSTLHMLSYGGSMENKLTLMKAKGKKKYKVQMH